MPRDTQCELFDFPHQTPPQARFSSMERVALRPDHAVLLIIAGLIGCSMVFACGVERGKQLARAEQPLLPLRATLSSGNASSVQTGPQPKAATPTPPPQPTSVAASNPVSAPLKAEPSPRTLAKRVAGASRFAIQVVTYRQTPLAQQELQRLQRRGEQAFMIKKEGRLVLLIGPFPTKAIASAKLVNLKQRYQDCFVRTL